ncbi:MAG: hypothetical protein ACRBBN_03080 [Methyloligellaceae bacterium]
MKVTPILTNIFVNAFAVVGFISVALILSMQLVLGEKPVLSCVNDRDFDFVSSQYTGGKQYELIRYPSLISKEKNVFVLYDRKDRIKGCIKKDKMIAMEIVGERGSTEKTYPTQIRVIKTGLKVEYSTSGKVDLHNLPVIWDMKSKMASVQ